VHCEQIKHLRGYLLSDIIMPENAKSPISRALHFAKKFCKKDLFKAILNLALRLVKML